MPHGLQPGAVGLHVAVIEEVAVAAMERLRPQGVLDGAEVLFGARRDFGHHGHEPVEITAVDAAELFKPVQVGQGSPIHHHVVLPFHPRNSVGRETNELVDHHVQI